jgi:hypothetical protein
MDHVSPDDGSRGVICVDEFLESCCHVKLCEGNGYYLRCVLQWRRNDLVGTIGGVGGRRSRLLIHGRVWGSLLRGCDGIEALGWRLSGLVSRCMEVGRPLHLLDLMELVLCSAGQDVGWRCGRGGARPRDSLA